VASTPEVSVIIATYNMARHLGEAVTSVLAQRSHDFEVIVVDDGSKDDTGRVLAGFAQDRRVRVIRQDNQGQPKAKNAGIQASRGRLLAFCDADDYWLPDKLERQLPLFARSSQPGVVYSPVSILQDDGTLHTPRQDCLRGDILGELFVRNVVPFGTAVVRRECIEAAGGFDESIPMGIDWDLWLRIAAHWHFDCVPEPTYVYRVWAGQMSHNWQGRYECALKIMASFLANHPGRIPQVVVDTAYADTYTSLASAHLEHVGAWQCLSYLSRALRHRATYAPAWRLLLGMPYYLLRDKVMR
jgi:glycosyltransferase involved in cell wall biosynthesis